MSSRPPQTPLQLPPTVKRRGRGGGGYASGYILKRGHRRLGCSAVEFYHRVDQEAARDDLHTVHDVADGFTRGHLSLQLQGESTRGHDETLWVL